MPNERAGDSGNQRSTIGDLAGAAGPGSVDGRHLLLVGAGPGLGMAGIFPGRREQVTQLAWPPLLSRFSWRGR